MRNDTEFDAVLKQMAAEHRPELPSPGLIWFRAQIARKRLERERIERPLAVMRGLACVISAIVLAAFLGGNWEQVRNVLDLRSWFFLPVLLLGLAGMLATSAMLLRSLAKR